MLLGLHRQLLAAQHRVESLDRGDDNLGVLVDRVGLEMLADVEGREAARVVRRDVVLELSERLVAKVVAIDQEQHSPGAPILDQPIDKGAGKVGLASAGRHLDQRTRIATGERLVQAGQLADAGDGLDLALAKARRIERG